MARSSVTPYLTDMVEAIERIHDKAGNASLEAFKLDWEKQWIVERGIEIVSEASRRVPDALKARHPDIPWQKVAAIGNYLCCLSTFADDLFHPSTNGKTP